MKTKYILLFLVATLGIGCSTTAKRMQKTYSSGFGEGMIVGTICIEKKIYNGYTFYYADDIPSINDYPNEQDSFSYKYDNLDYKKRENSYYLLSIVKLKKNINFLKLKLFNNTRNNQSTVEIPVNMKFEVETNKTIYFGMLTVNTYKKIYTVENQIERNRNFFNKKAPEIQF